MDAACLPRESTPRVVPRLQGGEQFFREFPLSSRDTGGGSLHVFRFVALKFQSRSRAAGQVLFSVWATLDEHKWSILAERRDAGEDAATIGRGSSLMTEV